MEIIIKEIRTEEKLLSLRSEWRDLLERSDSNLLFLTHEWVTCWWEHFRRQRSLASRSEPFVLALYRNDRLCGIAPLIIDVESILGIPFRIVRFLGYGASDYSDFIFAEDKKSLLYSIVEYLTVRSRAWDFLEIREFYSSSPNLTAFQEVVAKAGFVQNVEPDSICPYIYVKEDWESFYKSIFNSRRQRDHRREWRNLKAAGKLNFRFLNSFSKEPGLIGIMAEIQRGHPHASDDRPGDFNVVEYRKFLKAFIAKAEEKGWLTITLLELDGSVVAYWLGFRYNACQYLYSTSYVRQYRKLGVGKLLMMHMLEQYWTLDIDKIDFLRGNEDYKREWAKEERRNTRLIITQKTLRSRFACWVWFVLLPILEKRFRKIYNFISISSEDGLKVALRHGLSRLKHLHLRH